MSQYRKDFREAESEYFWSAPRVALAIFVGLVLLGGATWAFSIVSQPAAIASKTFNADNVINNYEWFHDANGNYLAKTAQVRQFKKMAADETDSQERSRLRIEMAAIQQSCRDLARRYNANATKSNRSIFMGRSLPESLSAGECE